MRYLLLLLFVSTPAVANDAVLVDLARQCAALSSDEARLACYDLVFRGQETENGTGPSESAGTDIIR